MLGFFLSGLAYTMLLILAPIGLLFSLFSADYWWRIAISLDQLGNVICCKPMNYLFINPDSKDKFGNPDETISSVLGKNQVSGNLTYHGKALVHFLSCLDDNHSVKSIEEDE